MENLVIEIWLNKKLLQHPGNSTFTTIQVLPKHVHDQTSATEKFTYKKS